MADTQTIRLRTVTLRIAENPEAPSAAGPTEAAPILRSIFADLDNDREHFVILALNAKNRVVGFKVCHTGAMSYGNIDARCIFRDALSLGAASLILAHNHPSGDPEPSPEDRATTNRLVEIGHFLGIEVVDHFVLGAGDRLVSFNQRGLMPVNIRDWR